MLKLNDVLREEALSPFAVMIKSSLAGLYNTHASGIQLDWQTPLNGLFHPQREADHYAKTTEGTQKYINEQ